MYMHFFFFKQKTAYEMRISDWSSDVCSSDLSPRPRNAGLFGRTLLSVARGRCRQRRRPARKVTDDRLTVQMQQSANSQKPRAKSPDAAVLQAVERALAELRRGASVVLYDWSGQDRKSTRLNSSH